MCISQVKCMILVLTNINLINNHIGTHAPTNLSLCIVHTTT